MLEIKRIPNCNVFSSECTIIVCAGQYANGRLAIALYVEEDAFVELFATLTVNLPDEPLDDGEVFVKNWSVNEILFPWVEEQGILARPTGRVVPSGFVLVPVYRLHPSFIEALLAKLAPRSDSKVW